MARLEVEGAFVVYPPQPEWLAEFKDGQWFCVINIHGNVRDPARPIGMRSPPDKYVTYLPGTPEWEACLARLMTKIMKG